MNLPASQRLIIFYTMLGPTILSLLGCLFVLGMFASFRDLRSISFKMIAILAGFDLVNAIAFILPTYNVSDGAAICQTQAVLLNFSSLAGLIWTTYMAFFLYFTLKPGQNLEKTGLFLTFLLTCLICSVATVIPAVILPNNAYGKSHGWCWIKDSEYILRDFLFFGPVILIIPLNLSIYLKISLRVNTILSSQEDLQLKQKIKQKLILYPLILAVCYVPYTIKAFLEFNRVDTNEFVFTLVAGVLRCCHGLLNFMVYGMNSVVKGKLSEWYKRRGYSLGGSYKDSVISMESALPFMY